MERERKINKTVHRHVLIVKCTFDSYGKAQKNLRKCGNTTTIEFLTHGFQFNQSSMPKRDYCPVCYKHLNEKYISQHCESKHPSVSKIDLNAWKWELRKLVQVTIMAACAQMRPLFTILITVKIRDF